MDEIALQSNLLALNAGVETARAAEAGRVLPVVAAEMLGLARRSAEADEEVKALISSSTAQVGSGALTPSDSSTARDQTSPECLGRTHRAPCKAALDDRPRCSSG